MQRNLHGLLLWFSGYCNGVRKSYQVQFESCKEDTCNLATRQSLVLHDLKVHVHDVVLPGYTIKPNVFLQSHSSVGDLEFEHHSPPATCLRVCRVPNKNDTNPKYFHRLFTGSSDKVLRIFDCNVREFYLSVPRIHI